MTQSSRHTLAEEWFRNAGNALGYAKTGFSDTSFYGWICFLCHQSAELYFKGFFIFQDAKPPKIHDLTKLLELAVKQEQSLGVLISECKILNRYYIAVRYPPELPNVEKDEAQEAIAMATKIETAIMEFRKNKK